MQGLPQHGIEGLADIDAYLLIPVRPGESRDVQRQHRANLPADRDARHVMADRGVQLIGPEADELLLAELFGPYVRRQGATGFQRLDAEQESGQEIVIPGVRRSPVIGPAAWQEVGQQPMAFMAGHD
jgi:hypothetical protein